MDRDALVLNTFNRVASEYQEIFMNFDLYDDSYDTFCELLIQNADVLEIACGPGNITKYILTKRPDLNIDATDFADNMLALAKANVPQANFINLDARAINTLTKKYNGVLCGFCFPYLSKTECIKLIEDSAILLEQHGVLYFSFIEDEHGKSGFATSSDGAHTYHVFYHESEYFKKALIANCFMLILHDHKKYTRASGASEIHTIIIAQKI